MRLAGKTDIGSVRKENQDDFRAALLPQGAAWALVCDGMGGARGGKVASKSACDAIEAAFGERGLCAVGEEKTFLESALDAANYRIFRHAMQDESLAGMGTTAVCALVRGSAIHLCHAGDSRAYLFHAGRLTQLTHDHSYVQELVDCGTITAHEAEHHPQKNVITRALGVDNRLRPEYTSTVFIPGDWLLLCSDGLTNALSVEQIEKLLRSSDFYDAPDALVDAANAHGGQDNITALLLAATDTEAENG